MENTFQFENVSMLDHGQMVNQKYNELVADLNDGTSNKFEIPTLFRNNWDSLREYLYSPETLKVYHTYHDCGKPYCKVFREDGKIGYPDHAAISADIFKSVYPNIQNKNVIAELIACDMVFHASNMEEIEKFIDQKSRKFCLSLWLTSLAELYANKEMFDADNQLSFKIKYKKLARVLNKILL